MAPEQTPQNDPGAAGSPPDNTTPVAPAQPVAQGVPPATPVPTDAPTQLSQSPVQPDPLTAPVPLTQFGSAVGPETPALATPAPGRGNKKLTIIIAAVVAAVVLVSGVVYATVFHNNPDTVVGDAFGQLAIAESGTAKGSFLYEQTVGSGSKITANYDIKAAKSGDAQADIDLNMTSEGKTTSLKASLVGASDNSAYVKLSNVRPLVDSFMGTAQANAASPFDGLVTMIDGKWIVITPKDLDQDKEATERAECVEKVAKDFRKNGKQQRELRKVYNKNRFIITKSTGTEVVDGTLSNRYEIDFDEAKLQSFVDGAVETEVFKNADACYDGKLSKSYKDAEKTSPSRRDERDDADEYKPKIELWASIFDHKPTKFKISGDHEGTKISFENFFKLGASPKVSVPKGDVTVEELKAEMKKAQEAMLESYYGTGGAPQLRDDATDQGVALGAKTTREDFVSLLISRLFR